MEEVLPKINLDLWRLRVHYGSSLISKEVVVGIAFNVDRFCFFEVNYSSTISSIGVRRLNCCIKVKNRSSVVGVYNSSVIFGCNICESVCVLESYGCISSWSWWDYVYYSSIVSCFDVWTCHCIYSQCCKVKNIEKPTIFG